MTDPMFLTRDELDECRNQWHLHPAFDEAIEAMAQHAAMLGAKKALSDPHATTLDEAVDMLRQERYRASEVERQYAEAKDAVSLEPVTHGEFMHKLRAMRKEAADLKAFLAISDEARAVMVERLDAMAVWKREATVQLATLEREHNHLRAMFRMMQDTTKELESLNAILTRA
jgi:hypothetical protein